MYWQSKNTASSNCVSTSLSIFPTDSISMFRGQTLSTQTSFQQPDVLCVQYIIWGLSTHSGQNSSLSWAPAVSLAAPGTPPVSAGPSSPPPVHLQIQWISNGRHTSKTETFTQRDRLCNIFTTVCWLDFWNECRKEHPLMTMLVVTILNCIVIIIIKCECWFLMTWQLWCHLWCLDENNVIFKSFSLSVNILTVTKQPTQSSLLPFHVACVCVFVFFL